jgi:chromosome partitioning protein
VAEATVVAVVSEKGGIGKSSLAFELAAALDAVLIDFDWSGGGVTSSWGYDYHERRRQPLLDSLASGRTPQYLKRSYRPDLVPSHPDLTHYERGAGMADALLSRRLKSWAEEWQRTIVVDTHPGFNGLTRAAVLAADLLVVPVLLRERDLNALDRMLEEGLGENPVLLVPNMIPLVTPRAQLQRLRRLLAPFAGMPVGPPVSFHPWWPRRRLRSALVLAPNPGVKVARAAREIRAVAEAVRQNV